MEEEIMQKIKNFAVEECKRAFGFAGVAENDELIMINSGKEKDLKIKITLK